jgi:DNA repair exonuclease SbcCD nuclease subunit
MESVYLGALDCRIYGAGYRSMDCEGLLAGFRSRSDARYHIGILHGDPVHTGSPYCPITAAQIANSGLDYLALGHMHKQGGVRQGKTLCAWPGCPMGRGWDETGIKGVLTVELDRNRETVLQFLPVDGLRFYDLETAAGEDPARALGDLLPAGGSEDFYRVRFIGESRAPDLEELNKQFDRYPNLTLLDETVPIAPLWEKAGQDSLEGVCFRLLKDAMENADPQRREELELAAKICRSILQGQEVVLP